MICRLGCRSLGPLDLGDQVVRITHDLIGLSLRTLDEFGGGLSGCTALPLSTHSGSQIRHVICKSVEVERNASTELITPFRRNQQPDANSDDGSHESTEDGTRKSSTLIRLAHDISVLAVLLLVSVLAKALLTLVSGDLVALSLLTAWHALNRLKFEFWKVL